MADKGDTFKAFSCMKILNYSYFLSSKYLSQDLTDAKSTLVQVMGWCHLAKAVIWTSPDQYSWHKTMWPGHNVLDWGATKIGRSCNHINIDTLCSIMGIQWYHQNILQYSQDIISCFPCFFIYPQNITVLSIWLWLRFACNYFCRQEKEYKPQFML